MTDLVFQSKKIARRRNTNVIAIAEKADGRTGNPRRRRQERESSHPEHGRNDIELPRLKQEWLFAHEHVADQATTHGIHNANEHAGRNSKACLKSFAGTHHPVGPGGKRINNQECFG